MTEVQRTDEDILEYMKRFQDRALDCHEKVDESYLVQICIEGIDPDYRVHLVNHHFLTFATLVEAVRRLRNAIP